MIHEVMEGEEVRLTVAVLFGEVHRNVSVVISTLDGTAQGK